MWTSTEHRTRNPFMPSGAAEAFADGLQQSLMLRVMDEIDYGLMVIDSHGRLRHANHLARHELAAGRTIVSRSQCVLGATTELSEQIQTALENALRGQRRLLQLKRGEAELSMVFIPLSHPLEGDEPSVLVLLSRQNTSENLAVRMYARAQGLSPSEEMVMMGLCRGLGIPEIAEEHKVAQSTVRSQIKALREKTGCNSIRLLMQRVSSLPPVVPALRAMAPMPHNRMELVHN